MTKPTLGQRCADAIAQFGGSWPFIFIASAFISLWMLYNSYSPHPFDPAPYIGLNLVLSCVAAFQAPFILMASNRQAELDRLRDDLDLNTDLDTNKEIKELHKKLDLILSKLD